MKKHSIKMHKSERAVYSGFSLLEIIVYLAVSSFLITVMTTTFFAHLRRSAELEKIVIQKHEELIK